MTALEKEVTKGLTPKAMEADLKRLFRLQKFPSVRSPLLSTKPSPETP